MRWLLIICLVSLLLTTGCTDSRSKFDQVHLGIARAEVIKILGEPQEKETKTLGAWTGEVLRWRLGSRTIVLLIDEDRVSGKQLAGPARRAQGN
jgi:hypothetical protein